MDMGIYCIQSARYVTGEEPAYVTAREEKTKPELFKEVDETVYFDLEFPSGCIAKGTSSFNREVSSLQVKAEKESLVYPMRTGTVAKKALRLMVK